MEDLPYRRSTLENGLRVLTGEMPGTRSVAVSVYVGAGSRYEDDAAAGISHLLEHLLFKGTEKRRTAPEISALIESVGGIINASTDRELTVYYAKVAQPHFDRAADVLMDMARNALIEAAELEKERKVVIEEIAATEDSPSQLVDVLMDATMWPDQPLGRDIAGTEASVAAITRDAVLAYLRRQYVPNNIVVSAAGAIEHERVVEAASGALGDWARGEPQPWFPAVDGRKTAVALREKQTEQAHVQIAAEGVSNQDPDRFAVDMVSVVLGEGMSSRLFVELREQRALCYDVHSYATHFLDTGAFSVYAATDPERAVEAAQALLEQIASIRDHGVTPEELVKAKELSKGRLLLRLEDTRAVAGWLGGQEMLNGLVRTPEEVVALVEAVTEDDIRRVCRRLLAPPRLTLAVVGPFTSDAPFAALMG